MKPTQNPTQTPQVPTDGISISESHQLTFVEKQGVKLAICSLDGTDSQDSNATTTETPNQPLWIVQAQGYRQRHLAPALWRGLLGFDVDGVNVLHCHVSGRFAIVKTKDEAITVAKAWLNTRPKRSLKTTSSKGANS